MSVREMSLKFRVPFIHTIDLMLVASLARALRKIALSPLAEASGYVLFEVFLTILKTLLYSLDLRVGGSLENFHI